MEPQRIINVYSAVYSGRSKLFPQGAKLLVYEKVTTLDAPLKGPGAPPERIARVDILIGEGEPWFLIPRTTDISDIQFLGSRPG